MTQTISNTNEYRVLEFDGKFHIQVMTRRTIGILWWRKKITEWSGVDINGEALMYFPQIRIDTAVLIGKQSPFSSLSAAESKIDQWKKGTTIYTPSL